MKLGNCGVIWVPPARFRDIVPFGMVEPHQSEFINNNAGESYKLASGLHVAQLSEQNRAKGEAHTQ